MADLKKSANALATKAAFAAAKEAAERALDDALTSDEERERRKAEQTALAKRKRTKIIALGLVGLLLVLGVIGLAVSYWQWFFLLGLVGLAALYGRYRWRKWRRRAQEASVAEPKLAAPKQKARVIDVEPLPKASAAEEAQAIEEELAALKSRLDKH